MSRPEISRRPTGQEGHGWAKQITKKNLGNMAYQAVRDALMRGQLKPGERLLLRPMSQRLGISATPMREALLRLVSTDALALDDGGTVVVPRLTRNELTEIRTIRIDLEGRAAATAALRITAGEIAGLEALHARMESSQETGDFAEAVASNTQFHLALCHAAHLPILEEIVENLLVRCGPILSHLYDDGPPPPGPHAHLEVIACLRARQPDGARAAIGQDIDIGGRNLLRRVPGA